MIKRGRMGKILAFLLAFVLVASLADLVQVSAADTTFKAVYTVKQLKKAMKAKASTTIVFRTETYNDITIPSVKAAKNKNIYIVAPHSNVTNKAKFKTINVKGVSSYTEAVSGNTITWDNSYDDDLIIEKGKSVNKLTIKKWYGQDPNYIIREGAKIKSLSIVSYNGVKSEMDKKTKTLSIAYYGEYDDEGYFDAEYKLDGYGRIVNKKITTMVNDTGETSVYLYKYDKNGNCTEVTCTEPEYSYRSDVYEYDSDNNLLKWEIHDKSESVYSVNYENDANGNITRIKCETSDGEGYVTEYKYDKKGRCIKEEQDNKYLDVKYAYTYKYDSAGRLIKEAFEMTGSSFYYEYKYDKNGLLIEKTEMPNSYTTNYSRDYLGNCIFTTTNHVTSDGWMYDNGNVELVNEHLGDVIRYEDGFVSPIRDGAFDKAEYEKEGYTVVETTEELIQAIEPGARIIVAPGYYNMSEYIESHDGYVSDYVLIDDNWADGHELIICYCDDLVISGGYNVSYATELVIDPTHSAVIKFEHCNNIKLNSLTLGHTSQGSCYGNVVQLYQCGNVGLYNMDLYGCGVYGIGATTGCTGINVYNSVIRDCSGGMFEFESVNGPVTFTNCLFFGSAGGGYYSSGQSDPLSITFKKCYFGENETNFLYFRDDLHFEDCLWSEVTQYPDYSDD